MVGNITRMFTWLIDILSAKWNILQNDVELLIIISHNSKKLMDPKSEGNQF